MSQDTHESSAVPPNQISEDCELLFQYLRSIIYDRSPEKPCLGSLPPELEKLGKGLEYLDSAVSEMKTYAESLSNGELDGFAPSRGNMLCESLKNLQASLTHLTWQAKQVAMGDYSQTVSYLGEFSDAFNTMTRQLREREKALREEMRRERERSEIVEKYNKLLLGLIRRSREDILVTSVDSEHILYASDNSLTDAQCAELFHIFLKKKCNGDLAHAVDSDTDWTWEAEDSQHRFYRVTTSLMEWHGEPAYAHILFEVTKEKIAQGKLELEAYFDKLTKIGNRYFFHKKADELLSAGVDLVFCYCDLDRLKYVNDTYGHSEGDRYLCRFVETVKRHIRDNDVFVRMGGDEFCIILKKCSLQLAGSKLQRMQEEFSAFSGFEYGGSFSYGLVAVPRDHGPIIAEDIIAEADKAMYRQKKQRRKLRQK